MVLSKFLRGFDSPHPLHAERPLVKRPFLFSQIFQHFPHLCKSFDSFLFDPVLLTPTAFLLTKTLTKMLRPVGYVPTGPVAFEKNPLNSSVYFDTSCLAMCM